MIISKSPAEQGWEVQGNSHAYYLLTGSDDTLYAFHDDRVTAIKNNGATEWNFHLPDGWKLMTLKDDRTDDSDYLSAFGDRPIVSESNGTICLCLYSTESMKKILEAGTSEPGSDRRLSSKIIAISPDGNLAWEYDLSTQTMPGTDYDNSGSLSIQAYDDGAYVFHDYAEEVLDNNGKLLASIDSVSAPGAIDEAGNMYVIRAVRSDAVANGSTEAGGIEENGTADGLSDMTKTDTVEAHSRDGTMLWARDVGEKITVESYRYDQRRSLPMYLNDRLYVPVSNGTVTMWTNGTICWVRHVAGYDSVAPFELLPADKAGNVLMAATNDRSRNVQIISIAPDGNISDNRWSYSCDTPVAAIRDDGTVYTMNCNADDVSQAPEFAKLTELFKLDVLIASDISTGERLWTFDVPSDDLQHMILNGSNINQAILDLSKITDAERLNEMPDVYAGAQADNIPLSTSLDYKISIIPSPNVTYMSYYVAVYEDPIVFNRSECMYVNAIYALDSDGRLLWKKPVNGLVMATAADKNTIYYSTSDGKILAAPAGIVAGIALVTAACLLIRFLVFGTIARAKSRLEKNENRNEVLRYIANNPGVTAADISKNLRMNIGTIRYHLFVLTANHKVATHKEGEKFRRYFKHYDTHNPADREYLAVIRRKSLKKILEALVESPVLTSPELAKQLGRSVTTTNFHINVLVDKGIVARTSGTEKGFAYSIKAEHLEKIKELLGRL